MKNKQKKVSSLNLRTKLKTKQILKHQSVDQRKTLAGVTKKQNKTKCNKNQIRKDNGKNEQSKTTTENERSWKKVGSAGKFFFERNTFGVLGKYSSFTVKIKFDKFL